MAGGTLAPSFTMKERRVTAKDVAKAGGLPQLIAQLVDQAKKGTMETRTTAAASLKCLTEQASLHEATETLKKENSELIAEVRRAFRKWGRRPCPHAQLPSHLDRTQRAPLCQPKVSAWIGAPISP